MMRTWQKPDNNKKKSIEIYLKSTFNKNPWDQKSAHSCRNTRI